MAAVFPLGTHFAYLTDAGKCLPLRVTETFWSNDIDALPPGRLISQFTFEADWENWEMHPEGDEWVLQLSGIMTLVFEESSGLAPCRLEPGHFTIIPSGVWHTGNVEVSGQALFITVGAGTETRPR